MNRRLRVLLGALVGLGLLVAPSSAGAAAFEVTRASGALRDYHAAHDNPTDGAYASFVAVAYGGKTYVRFIVTGLDPAAVGRTLGGHVHVGPCVEGDDSASGAHYRTPGATVATPQTEIWLDFVVRPGGYGVATPVVPFVIPAGAAQSAVIHEQATQPPHGAAGPRMACLPVQF